jgi:photosystem II stability/assembly factor-like uncharacterized protein
MLTMRSIRILVALAALASIVPVAAQQGPTVDPGLYSGMRWRNVGPARGGRSIAAEGSDARPNEYWFGATGGGAWKTTDGGTTWNPMTDGKITTSSIGAVGICPSNPDVVYIGSGEADIRGNIMMGDGAYKTSDGGKTWNAIGLKDSQVIAKIRLHPSNTCDTALAAVLGHGFGTNDERGVFKTTDGGKTWKRTLFRDNKTGAVELVYDPKNANVVYTALWESQRSPWGMSSGGPGSGLFKSTDGGDTWSEITKNAGLPAGMWGKVGLSVSGADSNRVYALIENEPDGGLYVSDDAGASWKKINDSRNIRQRAFYYTRVYADPKVKDTVWILNVNIYKSTDAGKTLTNVRVPHGDNHDMWIAPGDSNRMIEANDGGANVSVNGGQTWTDQDYPTAQFYHVFLTAHIPYQICGAQQDNSTACMSSQAGSFGQDTYYYDVGGGESGYIAPDPLDENVYYAGSYGGLLTRYDRRTGQQRNINIWPDNPMGYGSEGITERFQWTFPIIFSPVDKKTIYASSQSIWKTTNAGQSWTKISPDLSRHDPKTMGPSGGPITKDNTGVETYGVVFTIAPTPQDINTIWAGSDDGLIHVTRNGGQSWENITPKDLPEFARISLIEASPHTLGTAYVAANRYQMDDQKPYVYKTTDYGKTWTKIVNGVKDTHFARQVREDIKRKGLLYLGTENGIYVSFDDGANWQPLQLNLPDTSIQGIQVADRDLVIATHGRSFWILDNIGVLRQATPTLTNENLHLFDPVDPQRGLDRNIAIDYYLKNDQDSVTIEFVDAQGNVVRSFTGDAKPPAANPDGDGGGFFGGPPARVGVKKGMNRFTWDMRYEGATVFPGMIMWAANPARGPLAPPADFTVRVTAGGETKSQGFTIGIDKRLEGSVTAADLAEQFKLATDIRNKVTEANSAVIQIRSIRDQVNQALEKVPERKKKEVQALADSLLKPIAVVEEEVYNTKLRSGQDPLNFPIRLNNKIAALQGVVESSDDKPTDQTYVVFKELSAKLDAQMQKLQQSLKTDLPRLNAALKREKIGEVDPNKKPAPPAPPKPQ